MKIYIHYKITEEPWGGGNSFLKAFRNYLINSPEHEYIDDINKDFDIFFVNGAHKAPGTYIDIQEISNRVKPNILMKVLGKKQIPVIYRLDGARKTYNGQKSEMDEIQENILNIANHVILQSNFTLSTFVDNNIHIPNYDIIYNGIDNGLFNLDGKAIWDKKQKLKIIAASWSSNINKGFQTISDFSLNRNIQVDFIGNWNDNIPKNNIIHTPPLKQNKLSEYFKNNHIFLFPSKNESCSNVLLEAISSGLPVFYHNSGANPEISKDCGIALPAVINQEAITELLYKMQTNYDLYYENIKKCRINFSMNTVAEKYIDVFKKVLNKK